MELLHQDSIRNRATRHTKVDIINLLLKLTLHKAHTVSRTMAIHLSNSVMEHQPRCNSHRNKATDNNQATALLHPKASTALPLHNNITLHQLHHLQATSPTKSHRATPPATQTLSAKQ